MRAFDINNLIWQDQDRANTDVQYFQVLATIGQESRKENETKWQMHRARCDTHQFSQGYYAFQLWKSYEISVIQTKRDIRVKVMKGKIMISFAQVKRWLQGGIMALLFMWKRHFKQIAIVSNNKHLKTWECTSNTFNQSIFEANQEHSEIAEWWY